MKFLIPFLLCALAALGQNKPVTYISTSLVQPSGLTLSNSFANTPTAALGIANKAYVDAVSGTNTVFEFSSSGLVATVGAGPLTWADGTQTTFAGGSVTMKANWTNYLMVDLQANDLHSFYRAIHSGGLFVARVITDSSGVVSYTQPASFAVPPSPVESFKRKGADGQPLMVGFSGDSLTDASGSGTFWRDQVFNSTYSSSNYNVAYATNVLQRNWAVGGTTAQYGAAVAAGYAVQTITNTTSGRLLGFAWHTDGSGPVIGNGFFAPVRLTQFVGRSQALNNHPDLQWIAFANNNGDFERQSVDLQTRRYREEGIPVILGTENSNSGSSTINFDDGDLWAQVASAYGAAVCDTWCYIQEANDNGTNTYADNVHQNGIGQGLWAKALRSVLNDRKQPFISSAPTIPSVLGSAVAWEKTNLFDRIDVAVRPSASTGDYGTSTIATNCLPRMMGMSTVHYITNGTTITFTHAGWLACDLILARGSGTNTFVGTADIIDQNGITRFSKALSFGDSSLGGTIPYTLNAFTFSDATNIVASYYTGSVLPGANLVAGGIRISVTSGQAAILCAAFYTLDSKEVPLNSIATYTLAGLPTGFRSEASPMLTVPQLWTDTNGYSMSIPFIGKGIQVALQSSTGGGYVQAYLDGVLVDTIDTYASGGTFPLIRNFFPQANNTGNNLDTPSGQHRLVLYLNGRNGSSDATPKTSKRRMALLWAKVFGGQALPSAAASQPVLQSDLAGLLNYNVRTISADYTVTSSDSVILVNANSANITISFPDTTTCTGQPVFVKNYAGNQTYKVTLASINASDTFEGTTATNRTLGFQEGIFLVSSGNGRWWNQAGSDGLKVQSLLSASTTTWNVSPNGLGNVAQVLVTNNTTLSIVGYTAGTTGRLKITQGGGFIFTWPTGSAFQNGTITLPSTSAAVLNVSFYAPDSSTLVWSRDLGDPGPATDTLAYAGTSVVVTGGKGPNQSSFLAVTNAFTLAWSGLSDNDGGVIVCYPAATNCTVTLPAGTLSTTGGTATVFGGTGSTNYTLLAWSVKAIGGTNLVFLNAPATPGYYR
jgi:hypothetical protein